VSYLVDTNVMSELRKGTRAHAELLRWWATVKAAEIHLSVLVVGEIRKGIEGRRKADPAQVAVLERWLEKLELAYKDKILDIDAGIAQVWGRLQVPNPLPIIDGLMAATALVHGLVFVTRNVRDVAATGCQCLNPFEPIAP
jgi:predicted nucleic acid-binding protein